MLGPAIHSTSEIRSGAIRQGLSYSEFSKVAEKKGVLTKAPVDF